MGRGGRRRPLHVHSCYSELCAYSTECTGGRRGARGAPLEGLEAARLGEARLVDVPADGSVRGLAVLAEHDVADVETLALLTEADYDRLGVSIGARRKLCGLLGGGAAEAPQLRKCKLLPLAGGWVRLARHGPPRGHANDLG